MLDMVICGCGHTRGHRPEYAHILKFLYTTQGRNVSLIGVPSEIRFSVTFYHRLQIAWNQTTQTKELFQRGIHCNPIVNVLDYRDIYAISNWRSHRLYFSINTIFSCHSACLYTLYVLSLLTITAHMPF